MDASITDTHNYFRGVGRQTQTNRWQFLYEKLGQFYSEIKFLQFYCTLYIVTILPILNSRLFVCLLNIGFTNTASTVLVTWNNLLLHYTRITWLFCMLLVISIHFALINSPYFISYICCLYLLINSSTLYNQLLCRWSCNLRQLEDPLIHFYNISTCKYFFTHNK